MYVRLSGFRDSYTYQVTFYFFVYLFLFHFFLDQDRTAIFQAFRDTPSGVLLCTVSGILTDCVLVQLLMGNVFSFFFLFPFSLTVVF